MRIKPVLVPDHDAAELRGLMDRFAEAATGPVKRQLTESVESDVAEGVADTRQLLQAYAGLYYNSRESAGNDMDYDTIQREMDQIEQQIAKQYGPAGVKKLQKYGYEQYHGRGSFDDDVVREAGVAEATMSRAAKGYEKYGKEGMAALAKAGREGRALDPVRDRYNRYDETAEAGVTEAAAENNPVINAITRRIMLQRTDLLSKYGPELVGQAIDEVADFVGDVEEIGSSDVSGWVRHVEQMLGNRESDVAEQQVDELSPKTLGSYIKKSSADAAERTGEVSGRNQFGKGAEFAVKAFYGDRIQPNPTRTDPRIAKRQAGVDQAVDRLTAEDVAEGIDPVEQLRADIQRFAR